MSGLETTPAHTNPTDWSIEYTTYFDRCGMTVNNVTKTIQPMEILQLHNEINYETNLVIILGCCDISTLLYLIMDGIRTDSWWLQGTIVSS